MIHKQQTISIISYTVHKQQINSIISYTVSHLMIHKQQNLPKQTITYTLNL